MAADTPDLKRIVKVARDFSRPFRIDDGRRFRLKDYAAGDTAHLDDEDKPPAQRGHNPQKVYTAKIRKPEAKDGDLVERCTAKRRELKEQPVDAPVGAGSYPADDEPF